MSSGERTSSTTLDTSYDTLAQSQPPLGRKPFSNASACVSCDDVILLPVIARVIGMHCASRTKKIEIELQIVL